MRLALLLACVALTFGCAQRPKMPDKAPPLGITADPLDTLDIATLSPQELQDRIEAIRVVQAARAAAERRQAVSETRRAITRDLRWIGGVLLLVGAGLAIASAFVSLIPTKAAWTSLGISGGVYGASWVLASLAPLEPFMPWVAGVSLLVSGGGVAWVVADWWRRQRVKAEGVQLAWGDEPRAGVALQAAVDPRVRVNRKAELNRVESAHERMAARAGVKP